MIMDSRALLSDKQAVTVAAASTDVLDLGAEGVTYDGVQLTKRKGIAEMIPLYIGVNETFTTAAGMTELDIFIETDDTDAFPSAKEVLKVTVPIAELLAGYIFPVDKLPRKITERFLRFRYAPTDGAGGAETANAGQISAGFVAAVDGMNKSGF